MTTQIPRGLARTIILYIKRRINEYEYIIEDHAQLTLVILADQLSQAEVVVRIRLVGSESKVIVIGLVIGIGESQILFHTDQLHEAPETTSDLLVKSVLFDESRFTYSGSIRVEKNALKTDAYQRNENLIISDKARAESSPKLEILANDVRCTHGAATSSINKDQLWYLASRGISPQSAEEMLTRGFFESAISKISDTIAQKEVRQFIWQTL